MFVSIYVYVRVRKRKVNNVCMILRELEVVFHNIISFSQTCENII